MACCDDNPLKKAESRLKKEGESAIADSDLDNISLRC